MSKAMKKAITTAATIAVICVALFAVMMMAGDSDTMPAAEFAKSKAIWCGVFIAVVAIGRALYRNGYLMDGNADTNDTHTIL